MLQLQIAGWRISLDGLDDLPSGLAEAIAARYAAFRAAGGAPPDVSVALALTSGPSSAISLDPLLQLRVTRQSDEFLLDAPELRGKIHLSRRQASLTVSQAACHAGLEYFLRTLIALLAYRTDGLLVHGAGLLVGGQAHLFIGQSGSGKSTVVALSPGAPALGDDLIALRREATGWRAYGTPFWNPEAGRRDGQTASGPLAGIYKLVQDRDVYLEPLSSAAATAELAANCPVINGDPAALPGLLGRCRELAGAVPVRRLHFRKDPTFWECLP